MAATPSPGAVALKNSVYVLPNTEGRTRGLRVECFGRYTRNGVTPPSAKRGSSRVSRMRKSAASSSAREEDYRALAADIRKFAHDTLSTRARSLSDEVRAAVEAALLRFRSGSPRLRRSTSFGARGARPPRGSSVAWNSASPRGTTEHHGRLEPRRSAVQKRTWVTRKGIHIDRIACAWLIRRFIDKNPTFKFVPARGCSPRQASSALTCSTRSSHDSDLCSFEVMLRAFDLRDRRSELSPRSSTTLT
jgi:hypothetical protein